MKEKNEKPHKKINFLEAATQLEDYAFFEDDPDVREMLRKAFVDGTVKEPAYKYPKLATLDDVGVSDVSHPETMLERAKTKTERELTEEMSETRMKKMMIVASADYMQQADTEEKLEIAEGDFTYLNRQVYGDMNALLFEDILRAERKRLEDFTASDDNSEHIAGYLARFFAETKVKKMSSHVFDDDLLRMLHDLVWQRYGEVLAAVPDTDSAKTYDAHESARIMNNALYAGGLSEKGWSVVVRRMNAVPETVSKKKLIALPKYTSRTADQLRRLVIHEQEVHARTSQNAKDAGIPILRVGTAKAASAQEGLGVLLECAVEGSWHNESFDRARDRYLAAGLAIGVDGKPRNARDTFELLWRMIAVREAVDGRITSLVEEKAKDTAVRHVENAFRGTMFKRPGVIYRKLKVYWEGLVKNALYFKKHEHNLVAALDRAMLGKYDHTNDKEYEKIVQILAEHAISAGIDTNKQK